MRTSLRRKILLYSSSVLIVLIVTMLVFVSYQADHFVNRRIRTEIEDGRGRIETAEEGRGFDVPGFSLSSFHSKLRG